MSLLPIIGNSAYTTLLSYALLAQADITTTTDVTVNDGSWGSAIAPAGTIVGTEDSVNVGTATTELTALVIAINALSPSTSYTGGGDPQIFTPGVYKSASTIVFTSGANIVFDAGGNINAQFFIIATSGITFADTAGVTLMNGALARNIFWVAGTAITHTGTQPLVFYGNQIAGSAITFDNAVTVDGSLYAGTDVTFIGDSIVNGINGLPAICYAKGTKILTQSGYVAIEDITTSDMLVTKGRIHNNSTFTESARFSAKPVVWTSSFTMRNLNSMSAPVCIKKDSLGENRPFEDLRVSPFHRMLVGGEMVLAITLVNGSTIVQDFSSDEVTYYHVELDTHSAIVANGVLSESYFDDLNRGIFEKSKRVATHYTLPKIGVPLIA